jgi:hypothetical protein
MDFDPAELDALSREELILRARARGVERPEQMTRVELRDEIVRRSEPDLERQRRSRGWLGVARDLLASVVESGLNLPDAAASIRGDGQLHEFQGPPPVATVTLAEIYAAQGHYEQALRMLDEVIEREPEHAVALTVRERIAEERDLGPGRRRKVVETKGDPILTPQAPPVVPRPAPPAAPAPAPAPEEAPAVIVAEPAPAVIVAEPAPAVIVAEPAPAVAAEPAPAIVAEPIVTAPAVSAAPDEKSTPVETPAAEPAAPAVPEPPVAVAAESVAPPAPGSPEPLVPPADVVPEAPAQPQLAAASPPAAEPAPIAPEVEPAPTIEPALLVLQRDGRAFVYWRVPHLSEALRLRTVTVRPSLSGPAITEEDYPLSMHVGGIWLPRSAAGTEVRAAVGDVSSAGFDVLAVARVVRGITASFEVPGVAVDPELEEAAEQAAGL